jgi:hypothetical protein
MSDFIPFVGFATLWAASCISCYYRGKAVGMLMVSRHYARRLPLPADGASERGTKG